MTLHSWPQPQLVCKPVQQPGQADQQQSHDQDRQFDGRTHCSFLSSTSVDFQLRCERGVIKNTHDPVPVSEAARDTHNDLIVAKVVAEHRVAHVPRIRVRVRQ
jgi:hypothetical protein